MLTYFVDMLIRTKSLLNKLLKQPMINQYQQNVYLVSTLVNVNNKKIWQQNSSLPQSIMCYRMVLEYAQFVWYIWKSSMIYSVTCLFSNMPYYVF